LAHFYHAKVTYYCVTPPRQGPSGSRSSLSLSWPVAISEIASICGGQQDKGPKPAPADSRLPEDPILAVAKVLPRGTVQLPPEVMERLGLRPGTKLIVATAEDAVIMRKAEVLLNRQRAGGIVKRLRSMFSQIPIRYVEE